MSRNAAIWSWVSLDVGMFRVAWCHGDSRVTMSETAENILTRMRRESMPPLIKLLLGETDPPLAIWVSFITADGRLTDDNRLTPPPGEKQWIAFNRLEYDGAFDGE